MVVSLIEKHDSFLQYFENNYYDIVEEDLIIFLSDISGQYNTSFHLLKSGNIKSENSI